MFKKEPRLILACNSTTPFNNKEKEDVCKHVDIITANGRVICRDCGVELGVDYTNSMIIGSNDNKQHGTHTFQYVGDPAMKRYHTNLGSEVKLYGTFSRDGHGNPLKDIKTFNRLRKLHNYDKYSGTEFRTLAIVNNIGSILNIPHYILEGAGHRYKRLLTSKIHIKNNITCIIFCLWDSIRAFKYPICLQEVLSTFKKQGHRVSKRSIIQDGCLYSEVLYRMGIKKSRPKTPRDYLGRVVGDVFNNEDIIKERLTFKGNSKSPDTYINELGRICFQILTALEKRLLFKGYNPLYCATACLYFSNLILARYTKRKIILTQEIISEICGVSSFELRSIYLKEFKPLLGKLTLKSIKLEE